MPSKEKELTLQNISARTFVGSGQKQTSGGMLRLSYMRHRASGVITDFRVQFGGYSITPVKHEKSPKLLTPFAKQHAS